MLSLWLSVDHAMSLDAPAAPFWWAVHTTCALPHVFDTVLAGLWPVQSCRTYVKS